jgi:hypothetical protein
MKSGLLRIGLVVAAILMMSLPQLNAQGASEADRLQKLEQAVQQLQERNAELESEVKSLKARSSATGAAPRAEGPTKTKIYSDGKNYVEKSVPIEKEAKNPWKLSSSLTELELFGDVRMRYDYRAGQTADTLPVAHPAAGVAGRDDWLERSRERYRLRLGLRGTLLDDWFFGIRLETSQNPRSTNVTFGDDTSGSSTAINNEPFSKVSDGINVGQAYVGYKGFPDIVLMGGRMPLSNVLVTTRMVFDDDINPEGLSEAWKHSFSFGQAGSASGYGKDGKTVAAVAESEPFLKLDLFANFAQLVYDDANPENPLGLRATTMANGTTQKVPNTDALMLAWQVGARFNFPKTLYFQIAPTLYNYTGNGDSFNVHFQGGDPFISNSASLAENQTGINSLLVYDMPWEFGWKINKLPMRIFGDFATNFDGNDRALAAGHPDKGDQRYAYQIGAGIGQLKKKHDWLLEAYWQHTEQYAVDPNLVDSDLFEYRLNLEGPAVRAGYMFSDAVWVAVTWGYAWRADNALGTGGNGDVGVNPLDRYQVFQADLNVKF